MKLMVSAILIGLYLFFCLALYLFQSKLIFFPQKISEASLEKIRKQYPDAEINLETSDGEKIHGWFLPSTNYRTDPLVIYFGGNAEEVSGNVTDERRLTMVSSLFLNYRGYGLSSGRPSAENLFKDALFIYDSMIEKGFKPDQVILLGRSLGTGVAVYLASKRNVRRVLLVAPFDSLKAVAQRHYPFVPVSYLLKHHFDSKTKAQTMTVPLKMILAGSDETIPHEHSMNLFKAWKGPKVKVTIDGATHNDIQVFDSYWNEITTFVQRGE